MKKLLFILLALPLILLVNSCEKEETGTDGDLLGEWDLYSEIHTTETGVINSITGDRESISTISSNSFSTFVNDCFYLWNDVTQQPDYFPCWNKEVWVFKYDLSLDLREFEYSDENMIVGNLIWHHEINWEYSQANNILTLGNGDPIFDADWEIILLTTSKLHIKRTSFSLLKDQGYYESTTEHRFNRL